MLLRQLWICGIFSLLFVVSGCNDSSNNDGPPACNVDEPSCEGNAVCVPGGDSGICQTPCDPQDVDACKGDKVCSPTQESYGCFSPIEFHGQITDASTGAPAEPIEGALVQFADASGIVVSDGATTNTSGEYAVVVPVPRLANGDIAAGEFTLKASAQGYEFFPTPVRPALPIVPSNNFVEDDSGTYVEAPTTSASLAPVPDADLGQATISGRIDAEGARGTLVVVECESPQCPYGFADRRGEFTIFNVPDGSYTLHAYNAGLVVEILPLDVAGEDIDGLIMNPIDTATTTVEGTLQIVNGSGGPGTSVVLVPASTFVQLDPILVRGIPAPGLRAPEPGTSPDIQGEFSIDGVPPGNYFVLPAFENDNLVRDPDTGIGGTEIVSVSVDGSQETVTLGQGFKVTPSLGLVSPGRDVPEAVGGSFELVWTDDSSEDNYQVIVFNSRGDKVWEDLEVPSVSGSSEVSVTYGGPSLEAGVYYQFIAKSIKSGSPISATEDLRGVFYLGE